MHFTYTLYTGRYPLLNDLPLNALGRPPDYYYNRYTTLYDLPLMANSTLPFLYGSRLLSGVPALRPFSVYDLEHAFGRFVDLLHK